MFCEALLMRVRGALQDAAKTGKPLDAIKLHECQCPPCFTEYRSADGTIDCKPKCDLDTCDERSGICQGGFSGGGGASSALNPSVKVSRLMSRPHDAVCQRLLGALLQHRQTLVLIVYVHCVGRLAMRTFSQSICGVHPQADWHIVMLRA